MLLEIDGITKEYRGRVLANDGISLSVDAGEVFGLLGHNGAGKTTLVNQVVGLAKPTSGRIMIGGRDAIANPGFARRSCSLQPQAHVPIVGLTGRQATELMGRLRGADAREAHARTVALCEALDIAQWLDVPADRLSGGVRRLVAFCLAAVHPGRIVVLDEPTNDVDPVRRRLLWGLVRALGDDGQAVLLVTHNVLEAERAVDRLAVLARGRVVADGTPSSLKATLGDELRLEMVLEPGLLGADVDRLAAAARLAMRIDRSGNRITASVAPDQVGRAVEWARDMRERGLVEEFSLGPATLEDVYIRLTGIVGPTVEKDGPEVKAKESLDALAA